MKNKLITEIEQKILKQLDNAQLEVLHIYAGIQSEIFILRDNRKSYQQIL